VICKSKDKFPNIVDIISSVDTGPVKTASELAGSGLAKYLLSMCIF
jgi:hypothetical protein